MKKIVLVILFIVIVLLLQLATNGTLSKTGNGEWIKVANIFWTLVFWLGLWQLSSNRYAERRGAAQWIGITGLAKAFLTFVLAYTLSMMGFALYWQIFHRAFMEASQLSEAIEFFDNDYGKYPGPAGPVTHEMIDELRGALSAKINTKRTDYLQQTESRNPFFTTWPGTANYEQDPWGHPFYLRLKSFYPEHRNSEDVSVISCGPNGKYEDGAGDDIVYIGPGH
ncbi:MAG TPA: hypothetical protein VIM73_01860 [Polyangiaceae bacterium]